MIKKDRQNYYFFIVNKNGGLQTFVQFKEVYREYNDDNGFDQVKMSTNLALSAASTFYAIDNMTKTTIPQCVTEIEKERDNEFERSNYIDLLITEYFMVSNFLTLTGLRFVTISSLQQLKQPFTREQSLNFQNELQKRHEINIQRMRQIYKLYTDYFTKDPFQSEDQPLPEQKRIQFERDIRDILDF